MTIYDIPSILARAAPLALTPVNIMAGFKVSGIFPLNPEIFTDSDFMPSYFTDRPAPAVPNLETTNNPEQTSNFPEQSTVHSLNSNPPKASNPSTPTQASNSEEAVPSSSTQTFPIAYQEGVPSTSKQTCPTPEELRPFEKAAPRKQTLRGKKKRKSAILTDTPVKNQLKMEKNVSKKRKLRKESDKRGEKKQNPIPATKLFGPSSSNVKGIKTSKPKKGIKSLHSSDEEDEDCLCIYCFEPYAKSKAKEK